MVATFSSTVRVLVGVPGQVIVGGVPVPTQRRMTMSPFSSEISCRSGFESTTPRFA